MSETRQCAKPNQIEEAENLLYPPTTHPPAVQQRHGSVPEGFGTKINTQTQGVKKKDVAGFASLAGFSRISRIGLNSCTLSRTRLPAVFG